MEQLLTERRAVRKWVRVSINFVRWNMNFLIEILNELLNVVEQLLIEGRVG